MRDQALHGGLRHHRCLRTVDAEDPDRGATRSRRAGQPGRTLRSKIPALTEALTGRFSEHHAFLALVHLDLIDQHIAAIEDITSRIEVVIKPFQGVSGWWARDYLVGHFCQPFPPSSSCPLDPASRNGSFWEHLWKDLWKDLWDDLRENLGRSTRCVRSMFYRDGILAEARIEDQRLLAWERIGPS